MKHFPFRALCALALILPALTAKAQDDPVDNEESAKTPRSLVDLLPEKGKPLPEPFWLVMEMSREGQAGRPGRSEKQYMGWSVTKTKDGYAFRMRVGQERYTNDALFVYDLKGKIKSYSSYRASKHSIRRVVGKFENDKWVLTRSYIDPDGKDAPRERKIEHDAAMLDKGVPFEWSPLIAAYHIRKGSLGYSLHLLHAEHADDPIAASAEDIGTEKVTYKGKPRNAHVLVVKMFEDRGDGDPEEEEDRIGMTMRFLDTGELIDAVLKEGQMVIKVKATSAGEIAKTFGLKDTGLGPKLTDPQFQFKDSQDADHDTAEADGDATPHENNDKEKK